MSEADKLLAELNARFRESLRAAGACDEAPPATDQDQVVARELLVLKFRRGIEVTLAELSAAGLLEWINSRPPSSGPSVPPVSGESVTIH